MKAKIDKARLNLLNQHPRPVTRRDFIRAGFIAASGVVMSPTVARWLTPFAEADTKTTPRCLVFDLAGGASIAGNFLVGKRGGAGDMLKSYDRLGWNPRATNALDNRFGLPMAGNNVSRVLTGMLQVMSAEAQARFRFGSIVHVAADDTSSNPLSILNVVAESGAKGSEVERPTGLNGVPSGGNSRPVKDAAGYEAFVVQSLQDLLGAVGLTGPLDQLSLESKKDLAKIIGDLSTHQAKKLLSSTPNDKVAEFIRETYTKTNEKVGPANNMDPRQDTNFQQLYQIQNNSEVTGPAVLRAALVMNALNKTTGPASITIGGCDYHDGSATTGDQKDQEIGLEIGRAIEAAHRIKVPLFIQILTDGSLASAPGSRAWTTEDGEKCSMIIGYYNPNGAPKYRTNTSQQIGAFTDAQGVDRDTIVATPVQAANAAFANYLHLCGRLGEFDQFGSAGIFTKEQLESVLIFEG